MACPNPIDTPHFSHSAPSFATSPLTLALSYPTPTTSSPFPSARLQAVVTDLPRLIAAARRLSHIPSSAFSFQDPHLSYSLPLRTSAGYFNWGIKAGDV